MSEEKQFVLFFYVAWWQRGSGASWPKSSSTGAALTRATGHARNRGRMPRARAQPSANRVDRSLAAARGEARRGAAKPPSAPSCVYPRRRRPAPGRGPGACSAPRLLRAYSAERAFAPRGCPPAALGVRGPWCIHVPGSWDRSDRQPHRRSGENAALRCVHHAMPRHARPVSYTHLTLPTNEFV